MRFPLLASLLVCLSAIADTPLYHVGNRLTGWNGGQAAHDTFLDVIQPILAKRCVACHGCYEAPCQTNFQSYEGVRRGFNPEPIYGSSRTRETYPTRMQDGTSVAHWRAKGFLPVVAHDDEPSVSNRATRAGLDESLLRRFVQSSQERNAPGFDLSSAKSVYEEISREKNSCVATDSQLRENFSRSNLWNVTSYDRFTQGHPGAGMPLGLPRLEGDEAAKLNDWLQSGARGPSAEAQGLLERSANAEVLRRWEDELLNVDSARGRLAARYVYEHLFTATLAFQELPGEFYELVRSRTRTGKIDEIVSELPYDAPGVPLVYYRLRKITRVAVQKTQILWRASFAKLEHLKALFFQSPGWPAQVAETGYASNNPFEYFSQIPGVVRSRFLIENSAVIVGAMTQGTVCVGSRATYAISDHFWAWFLKPERDVSALDPQLGLPDYDALGLAPHRWVPRNLAERALKNSLRGLDVLAMVQRMNLRWLEDRGYLVEFGKLLDKHGISGERAVDAVYHFARTVKGRKIYQEALERRLRVWLKQQGRQGLGLDDIWTGDGGDPMYPTGRNPNAWLNITRHEVSATVQFGAQGGRPQSVWVLSYSNFERLYYNLVASFKSWGSIEHRLATWRGMSYIRLEAEDLAISFLPPRHRNEVRARFARGLLGSAFNRAFFPHWSMVGMFENPGRFLNHFRRYDLPTRQTGVAGLDTPTADQAVTTLLGKTTEYLKHVAIEPGAEIADIGEARRAFEGRLNGLLDKSQLDDGVRYARHFPNITYVRLVGEKDSWMYTLLADRGYKAHNIIFAEDLNRWPERDTLSLYRGLVGAYPNLFLEVPTAKIDAFVARLASVGSEADFEALAREYGIARNSARFWPFFDWLHEWKAKKLPENDPDRAGVVDLSTYLFLAE